MAQTVTNDPDYFLNNQAQGSFNEKSEDASGLGIYPAAEQNNTYFTYFNAATSTEPEILGKSAVYINYLIDSEGNLTNPKPGDIALYNLKNSFTQGSTMFITPEDPSQVYSPLIGENSIENIGTIQLVMNTETGKTPSSFLPDIKIGTIANYNQLQSGVDYTIDYGLGTGNSPSLYINSASINSTFSPDFAPISSQSGDFSLQYPITSSASDTGSFDLINLSSSIETTLEFINESPSALNQNLTAELRLNWVAVMDQSIFPQYTGDDDFFSSYGSYLNQNNIKVNNRVNFFASIGQYTVKAKIQKYDTNLSTWEDLNLDINASYYTPGYGTKVAQIQSAIKDRGYMTGVTCTPAIIDGMTINTAGTEATFTGNQNYLGPNSNFNSRLGSGYIDTYGTRSPVQGDPQTGAPIHIMSKQNGDGNIYIKTTSFSANLGDKIRALIRITPSVTQTSLDINLSQFGGGPYSQAGVGTAVDILNYNQNEIKQISLLFQSRLPYDNYFGVKQSYDTDFQIPANDTLNITPESPGQTLISASYWNTGSVPSVNSNQLMWLTASQALSLRLTDSQTYYQVFYDSTSVMESLGFSQPSLPITPQPGDYIRFERDLNKQYRILRTEPDNIYGFAIGIYPPIAGNVQLNHFTICRVIDDGNYILINKQYPASGSVTDNLTGFAKPKYITSKLESEFTKITTDLVKSGVLKNQV